MILVQFDPYCIFLECCTLNISPPCFQALMGRPYGSIPRKTVPRPDESSAMDFAVLWDFGVSYQCTASSESTMFSYCRQSSLEIVSAGLCSVFGPLLWLLQQPAHHWLAQVPHATVVLPRRRGDCGLQLHGGHSNVGIIMTYKSFYLKSQ